TQPSTLRRRNALASLRSIVIVGAKPMYPVVTWIRGAHFSWPHGDPNSGATHASLPKNV
ncbi:unnamed protein product, partial [Nesidiocoris tenuis]